jgi:hypothetical protein
MKPPIVVSVIVDLSMAAHASAFLASHRVDVLPDKAIWNFEAAKLSKPNTVEYGCS